MTQAAEHRLLTLFEEWSGEKLIRNVPMPPSGSNREYYRLESTSHTAIGAYNPNKKENLAFITFTRHFLSKGLAVPQLYAVDLEQDVYIVEDLGDVTLFSYLQLSKEAGVFPIDAYKKVVEALARFQIEGGRGLDYSVCYPRPMFDEQSILWDLSYFKHFFLKLAQISYDEQELEDDFHSFASYLTGADCSHFLFRDFQSRNIMLRGGEPYFIDYQGGRQGALQYDLASLLFQAKADLSVELRQILLEHYLDALAEYIPVDREQFVEHYHAYVLIRTIQVLGAYGFRGFYERKEHFLSSIPYAVANTRWLLDHAPLPIHIPALTAVLEEITVSESLKKFGPRTFEDPTLTVTVNSFSYRSGIPTDTSGNGGGYIFDCRAIHNPGRYEPYKHLTGRDPEVIRFFQKESDIDAFLRRVYTLIDPTVEVYLDRGFTDLSVSFGCTGGQHRSVYCADQLAQHLKEKYKIPVHLTHIEQEKKSWQN